uniref:CSON002639 protein n=1 Tax=Culicoides sonorensis TaxID=179676 RepID=A0A336L3V2_CULSO
MNWYYKFLANRPYLLVLSIGIFSFSCIITSYVCNKLPDFSDPTVGFEARGTVIGQRLTAWRNLLEESGISGLITVNPKELIIPRAVEKAKIKALNKNKNSTIRVKKKKNKIKTEEKLSNIRLNKIHFDEDAKFIEDLENSTYLNFTNQWDYGKNLSFMTEEKNQNIVENKAKWSDLRQSKPPSQKINISNGYFCDSPRNEYAHFVITSVNHEKHSSLFDITNLLAICDLEQKLSSIDGYRDICQRPMSSKQCCRPWSLPNYIALLTNKEDCFQINNTDIQFVKQLLIECYPYFDSLKLSNDCTESKCHVPENCSQHNAVFNIIQFMTDVEFINVNESTVFLKETMLFLPIARSSKALSYYHNLDKTVLSNERVKVVAMDLGLKNVLFDECLLTDGWLIALGGCFVIICMWFYTSSLFVTIMTIVAIIFSLGISYFLYTIIFNINFFPFMNLMAVIVIIGIGADDAFIFMKIWKCTLSDHVKSSGIPLANPSATCLSELATTQAQNKEALYNTLRHTLEHATVSMLVTSFTTAAAFYASIFSTITAVRCFGIFAGTLVLVNFLLMITWLPAIVSIKEGLSLKYKCLKLSSLSSSLFKCGKKLENGIINLVTFFPIFWMTLLRILSSIIVLYWPKLQLPDSADFKLFVNDHPFELYETTYKDRFWFEKVYSSTDNFKLPLRFVWGIEPIDTGNYLDPLSRGQLTFDSSFNVSSPESQIWLLNFCKSLKQQQFTSLSYGLLLPNCFIENFIQWMSRRCLDDMSGINRYPCCEDSTFPFNSEIFDICLPESISSLYETPREYFMPGLAGPKFSRRNVSISNNTVYSTVMAIVIEYDSTQFFTMSYTEMSKFVDMVETWFTEILKSAPNGLKRGWFISDLEFYDLQNSLSKGTLLSILLSIGISLLVLLMVTLNIFVSFYAIVTVALSIFTTIAILVCMNWKLNVLESIAVSTVIGLSIDFSLHYGVHYRLCNEPNRQSAAKFAISRMLQPTLMAAVTTIVAGTLMLFSSVLAYIQIGIFLVVVMAVSWIFSTFFLMSTLYLIGPQYGFGQFEFPKFFQNKNDNNCVIKRIDIDNRMVHHQSFASENLISVSELVTSESHELDSLTSSSIIKQLDYTRSSNLPNYKKKYSYPRENSPSIGSIVTVLPDDSINIE